MNVDPRIEIKLTGQGRSQFDRVRWRCKGGGDGASCEIWHSAMSEQSAVRTAKTHLALHHGGPA